MSSLPPLTSDIIDNLPDDDPDEAFDLLMAYDIDTTGVTDTADAKKLLKQHLSRVVKPKFQCKECNLIEDDFEKLEQLPLSGIQFQLRTHFIGESVQSVEEALDLLRIHLQLKKEHYENAILPNYSTEEVAKVVRKVVEENRTGRLKLQEQLGRVKNFVQSIPAARTDDVKRQLPHLDDDLVSINKQLESDNCIIMVAGETGAGKSCLLNLLLGELTSQLMAVNNLPSTSALCEIKYGKKPELRAYPTQPDASMVRVSLARRDKAPDIIAEYTSQRDDREELLYKKVEVYWDCEWIKDGITITDTPGIGESDELTKLVKDYIPTAFGFIYVINTPNAGGINPEELGDLLMYHIARQGIKGEDATIGEAHEKIKFDPRSAIFVCNKWDQVPSKEQEEVKNYVNRKLQKAWKGFDFQKQVYFISTTKTIDELKGGYVSKEFRRLLLGIQNLLPVGFRTKMETQFWKMFNIMDRCTWMLKNYLLCGQNKEDKQVKQKQYLEAKKRLSDLEKRPESARKEMESTLETEVNRAMDRITQHMMSEEVLGRLAAWKESECPDNDNLDRLHQLQSAYAQKKLKQEINKFETEQRLFEDIQKNLMSKFQSIFVSVENELNNIELALKDQDSELSSLTSEFQMVNPKDGTLPSQAKLGGKAGGSQIWVPLGVVIGAFALPFVSIKNLHKQKAQKKELKAYRANKPAEMAKITKSLLDDLLASEKLQSVIEDKLNLLKMKFTYMLEKIPELIAANKKLISDLQQEIQNEGSFEDYLPVYQEGSVLQDDMNYVYMTEVRTYDINMDDIKEMKRVGEGSFAIVYKGKYTVDGKTQLVAVKRLREALTRSNVTDFLTEEINLTHIQAPNVVRYLGTSVRRSDDVVYPVMVQEYCKITLDKIIYDKRNYQGPGSVPESHPDRPRLAKRAAQYVDEISRGLHAMHCLGFVHRDLKPENILMDIQADGTQVIKLCDLGITKRESDITKTVAGTPMYMAPEISEEKKYDRTVDMFALGLMAWEIWFGAPIEQVYTIDNYKNFCKDPYRNKQYKPPQEWRTLISRCWSKEPTERPSAKELSDVFSKLYIK